MTGAQAVTASEVKNVSGVGHFVLCITGDPTGAQWHTLPGGEHRYVTPLWSKCVVFEMSVSVVKKCHCHQKRCECMWCVLQCSKQVAKCVLHCQGDL